MPEIHLMTEDMVLASIFGGVITGVGIGMVFLARATTGGTDMLAAVIQHYLKHYSIAFEYIPVAFKPVAPRFSSFITTCAIS